jgi:tRNA pseudouridine55 synthase
MLLLDKPTGLTSNAALQRAKRLFRAEKVGHTGTLDPLASGLLPLCFGDATKFAQALLDARKEYIATVRFGIATSTGDSEGVTIAEKAADFTRANLEGALLQFVGRIQQVPPRHAALKHEGRAYYEYARKGVEIPRVPREIDVGFIEILGVTLPTVVLRVECGKGTYIRVLAEDLGAALGTCAHLAALRRVASGAFRIEQAVTLDSLEALDSAGRDTLLLRVDALLAELPRLDVEKQDSRALRNGQTVAAAAAAGRYRCYGADSFVGIVDITDGRMRAVRLARTN